MRDRRFAWRTRMLVQMWRDIPPGDNGWGVTYRAVVLFAFLAGCLNIAMVILNLAITFGLGWWA